MLIDKWNNEGEDAVKTYIDNKKEMQTAAKAMGDYGQGTALSGTGIHRILRQSEMFGTTTGTDGKPQTLAQAARLRLTAGDYRPTQTTSGEQVLSTTTGPDTDTHYGDTTTTYGTTTSWDNVWSLLNKLPDTTTTRTVTTPGGLIDTDDTDTDDTDTDDTDGGEVITTTNTDINYLPDLESNVQDQSGYGQLKGEFDDTAAGIDTTAKTDNTIQSADYSKAGRSARGVRLKRSKKFKSGESALGTKQLSRQLQIKSLNI